MRESDFIDAINAAPDDRIPQLIYADWLDGLDDPRAEAWRVLIEVGKRADFWQHRDDIPKSFHGWGWSFWEECETPSRNLLGFIDYSVWNSEILWKGCKTFWHAMNRLAIAWVRANRDADFMREPNGKPSPVVTFDWDTLTCIGGPYHGKPLQIRREQRHFDYPVPQPIPITRSYEAEFSATYEVRHYRRETFVFQPRRQRRDYLVHYDVDGDEALRMILELPYDRPAR